MNASRSRDLPVPAAPRTSTNVGARASKQARASASSWASSRGRAITPSAIPASTARASPVTRSVRWPASSGPGATSISAATWRAAAAPRKVSPGGAAEASASAARTTSAAAWSSARGRTMIRAGSSPARPPPVRSISARAARTARTASSPSATGAPNSAVMVRSCDDSGVPPSPTTMRSRSSPGSCNSRTWVAPWVITAAAAGPLDVTSVQRNTSAVATRASARRSGAPVVVVMGVAGGVAGVGWASLRDDASANAPVSSASW